MSDRLTLAEMKFAPEADSAADMRPDKPEPCLACRGHHGSIGAEILCLRRALQAARERNR